MTLVNLLLLFLDIKDLIGIVKARNATNTFSWLMLMKAQQEIGMLLVQFASKYSHNLVPRVFHLPTPKGWGGEMRDPGNEVRIIKRNCSRETSDVSDSEDNVSPRIDG